MGNAGLIVIAIFGGALLVLLLVGMAVLGWVLWQVTAAVAEHAKQLAGHSAETKTAIEGAKASFASIRTEIGRQQAEFIRDTTKLLEAHASMVSGAIGKINAEALEAASVRGLQACVRMEKVAVALQRMLMTVDNEPENHLGPEEYAPNDNTIYAGVSNVARSDAEAAAEDNEGAFTLR